ncbi:unnamed protein product [Camellia sinensis]
MCLQVLSSSYKFCGKHSIEMQAESLASFAHSAGQTSVVAVSFARINKETFNKEMTCILRSAESGQSYSKGHDKATQEIIKTGASPMVLMGELPPLCPESLFPSTSRSSTGMRYMEKKKTLKSEDSSCYKNSSEAIQPNPQPSSNVSMNHLPAFRFQNLGEMMTLGRNDAAISPSFLEGLTLEGPIGHTVRKIAYLARLPTDEHRLKVGISWFVKSAVDSVTTLQSTVAKVVSGA